MEGKRSDLASVLRENIGGLIVVAAPQAHGIVLRGGDDGGLGGVEDGRVHLLGVTCQRRHLLALDEHISSPLVHHSIIKWKRL